MQRWSWIWASMLAAMLALPACDGNDPNAPRMLFGGPDSPPAESLQGSIETVGPTLCQKVIACGLTASLEACLAEVEQLAQQFSSYGISDPWGLLGCIADFPCSAFAETDTLGQIAAAQCGQFLQGGQMPDDRSSGRSDSPPRPDAGMSLPGLDI